MRVDNNQVNRAAQPEEGSSTRKTEKSRQSSQSTGASGSSAATESTSAEISQKAREFAKAKAAASSAPDVRAEKIAELKRKIASGEYNVKPDAIADRLVDEHLSTRGMD